MKKLLIFGYSGFVGPYLAKEFADDGYEVYGCDINEPSDNCVAFFRCNILQFDDVDSVISKILPDVIINLAAISSVGQSWNVPQKTISVNVVGTINIMESIKLNGIKPRVLLVGSSEEYVSSDKKIDESSQLNANNPYGISKITQEMFAEVYRQRLGIKIFCVRSFNHTGVGQKDSFVLPSFCKQVAEIEKSGKHGTIYVGNLEVYRDFSDVRDIVSAYKLVIDSYDDSIVYNIGSGKAYLLKDLLDYIISLSNQKVFVKVDKERYRPVDNKTICCDNAKIRKELDWSPKYSIKDTLKEMFEFYLRQHG